MAVAYAATANNPAWPIGRMPVWPVSRSTLRASSPKISIWVSRASGAASASPAAIPTAARVMSGLAPEQAGRAHEQQQGHRTEHHEVGELGEQPATVRVHQPDDEAPDHRALEAAQPAHDHDH